MPSDTSRSVTELLDAWGRGDRAALEALVPTVEWAAARAWLRPALTIA